MKNLFNLRLRDYRVVTFSRPAIMGVINVSPNSFYNPHLNLDSALRTVEKMVTEGADFLDIGGEATNPFVDIALDSPSLQQELDRVLPVVTAIKQRFDILISVDTSRPTVMQAAVEMGADIVNDQRALRLANALSTVSELKVPVCLMHFFQPVRQAGSSDCVTLLRTIKKQLTSLSRKGY